MDELNQNHAESDFSASAKIGKKKLFEDDFAGCIDIKRCRSTHILPLPVCFDGLRFNIKVQSPEMTANLADSKPAELLQPTFVENVAAGKQPENRIDQWKRKLLDLSLRNRLLNYRATAKTIQIASGSLARLEDCLASGLPSMHLRWHYRSLHESLITFSNQKIVLEPVNRCLIYPYQ